jgi:2-dehydropantoate 2-reductase
LLARGAASDGAFSLTGYAPRAKIAPMKLCIVGAGAIGGFLGVRLARAGAKVTALARGAAADAIRCHGWRLHTGGETLTARVAVAEQAQSAGPQNLIVIAVKTPSLAAVAQSIEPLLGPDTVVLTANNGVPWWFFHGLQGPWRDHPLRSVDPHGRIAAAFATRRVVGCVVHASCLLLEPGVVRHVMGNELIIGEPAGGQSARVRMLGQLLRQAGFGVTLSERIQADIWYKLWGNMTVNPISALTGATADLILDDALVNEFVLRVMAEAAAIGNRIGCPIAQSGEDRNAVTRRLGAFKTSMLQDVEAGKPLEIDALLSAVCEIAALVNVPAPNTGALLGLTRLFARQRGLYPRV